MGTHDNGEIWILALNNNASTAHFLARTRDENESWRGGGGAEGRRREEECVAGGGLDAEGTRWGLLNETSALAGRVVSLEEGREALLH